MSGRFFDGERATDHPVTLTVRAAGLDIRSVDGRSAQHWPIEDISLSGGPEVDGTVTLSRPGYAARLLTNDADLLRRLAEYGGPRVPKRSPGARRRHVLALPVAVVAIVGLAIAFGLDRIPDLAAPWLPNRWTSAFGRTIESGLALDHRRCTAEPGLAHLRALVDRLARAADRQQPVSVAVIDDPVINALTLPGSRIVVMRGLIDQIGDPDELAGVLAHEMGHVMRRDPEVAMLRNLGLSAIASLLGIGGGSVNAPDLVSLSYSRSAEAAADEAAIRYLSAAGMSTDGLARFFARLQALEAKTGAAEAGWLATHPPTAKRRQHVSGEAGVPALDLADWSALKSVCG
jgi:Zn-dependent protease with chaperone function